MPKTLLILLLLSQLAHAQDALRESLAGSEMTQRHPDTVVSLDAGSQKFAGVFVAAIPKDKRGGVIMIHGDDAPPDSRDLLEPLRDKLPQKGWDTLAIQTALPEQAAATEQYLGLLPLAQARIDAAIQFLDQRQSTPIMLMGYGAGTLAVLRFAAEKQEAKLGGVVIVETPSDPALQAPLVADLAKIKSPLLDITSHRTNTLTTELNLNRKRAQKDNPGYRQIVLIDAERGYQELEEMLINRIHGWLSKMADEAKQPPAPKP